MLQLIYTLCQMTSGWGQGASLETIPIFPLALSAFPPSLQPIGGREELAKERSKQLSGIATLRTSSSTAQRVKRIRRRECFSK